MVVHTAVLLAVLTAAGELARLFVCVLVRVWRSWRQRTTSAVCVQATTARATIPIPVLIYHPVPVPAQLAFPIQSRVPASVLQDGGLRLRAFIRAGTHFRVSD